MVATADPPGSQIAAMRPDGPADLQSYVLVRLPDVVSNAAAFASGDGALTAVSSQRFPAAAATANDLAAVGPTPRNRPPSIDQQGHIGGIPTLSTAIYEREDTTASMLTVTPAAAAAAKKSGSISGSGPLPLNTSNSSGNAAAAAPVPVVAALTDAERRAMYWYGIDEAEAHLASPLADLVLAYHQPPKANRVSMLAAAAPPPPADPSAAFVARRLHPAVPIVIADVSATTKALHALAVTIVTAAPVPTAQPLPPPSPMAFSGAHGSTHSHHNRNGGGGEYHQHHQAQGSMLLAVPSHGSGTAGRTPNGPAPPHTFPNSNTAAAAGGSVSSSGGRITPTSPAAQAALQQLQQMGTSLVWWYAGKHPLVYVGGRPHVAVMRAARRTLFASALVTVRAPPQQGRKASSGVMNPRPPRAPGVSGPSRGSMAAVGASARLSTSTAGGGGDLQSETSLSNLTNEAAPTSYQQQQQQQQQSEDPVMTEYPAWPEATIVPAPTAFDATVAKWGGAVSWPAIEERLKAQIEADLAASDGVLFRYVLLAANGNGNGNGSSDPASEPLATRTTMSLETADIRPDVARVVKAKKVTPKPEDAGGRDGGATDRRKTRHLSRSTASSATGGGGVSHADDTTMTKSTTVAPMPPSGAPPPHGSIRLERRGSNVGQQRPSISESVQNSESRFPINGGGGAANGGPAPPALPTNATDGVVQPLNEALQSVLTLPLTHAAVAGINAADAVSTSSPSGVAVPTRQVVMRAPAFDSLDEHIDGVARVLAAMPRSGVAAGGLGHAAIPTAAAATPKHNGAAAAAAGMMSASLALPVPLGVAGPAAPSTHVILVSGEQDLVLAAAATLAWCGWCAPAATAASSSQNQPAANAASSLTNYASAKHGGGVPASTSSQAADHAAAPGDFRSSLMLQEAIARHGSDYTRPGSAGSEGDGAGGGASGGGIGFVPDVAAAAKAAERGNRDDGEDSDDASSASGADLNDLSSGGGGDGAIDEVESDDGHSSDHRPLFTTVTLRSRAVVDNFPLPAAKAPTAASGTASPSYLATGPSSPTMAAAAAAAAAEAALRRQRRHPSLQPLACLDALAVRPELQSIDFSIHEAQHIVTATLHRTGLYAAIRRPVDDLLEVERCVLAVDTIKAPVPPADVLREMAKAASRGIERYALLVFAQCYIASDAWRDRPERTFADFLDYYPPLARFLRSPDTLFQAEIPLPVFAEALAKPPPSQQQQNHSATSDVRPGGLRQPQSARAAPPAAGGKDQGPRHPPSLPQTARTVMMASRLGVEAVQRAPPGPWPLVRTRVLPMDLPDLLAAPTRWDNASVCHSLA